MAAISGHKGAIKSETKTLGRLQSFSLNINNSVIDVSELGKDWKEYIEGIKDWSGSASGYLDYEDTMQKQITDSIISGATTGLTLDFKVHDTLELTGSVLISSLSITVSTSDKVGVSFNFTGSGAISKKVSS